MTQIEVILLSLLCDKDYYGYEFETVIEQRNMRGWTNIGFSSIYNSLNKLEKNGHIVSKYEKEYGSPKRKVYSIKDETKVLIKEQIIKMISEYNSDPSEFDIGMLFSYLLVKEELKEALTNHKENLIKRKEFLLERYDKHPTARQRPHIKALFERPLAFLDTEISWLEEFISENF
ncbi:PadR family transcriptional regulator [Clostridium tagluense]|uniref:PadR family transcriptional regulator n=1 Tax=Clostridium tagluense TaxID=360422 RepID=UPI001CF20841|nr:PadR family transcriptional regulator [Clostridium tagluense]MCB2298178.1 PadR family transcriptional regulator [Clostridium tagluense]